MRVTSKLSIVLTAAFAVLLAIDVALGVARQVEFYETATKRDLASQGQILADAIAKLWEHYGREGALQVLQAANEPNSTVRATFIDAARFATAQELDADEQQRLQRGEIVADVRTAEGVDLLARALSVVQINDKVEGAVVLERKILSRREVAMARAPRLVITVLLLIGVAAVVSLVVGRRVVGRAVDALAAKAERAGHGDFGGPLVLKQSDELGSLARAMNQMCADLDESSRKLASEVEARVLALNQLRRADRLMTVGRLAAGLAHELGTPINVVSERIKMAAAGELPAADVPRNNQRMLEQLDRMSRIIRQLLDFARQRPPEKTDADLVKLVRHVADLLRPLAEKARVTLAIATPDGPATAKVDAQQIEQAVSNLLVNAFQAMPEGGVVELRLHHRASGFCIEVVDHGTGIAKGDLVRIFEPFFTTKDVGEGTGLGLSVVHGIVEEHGGRIEVDSVIGAGTTFRVVLPTGALV